MAEQPPITTTIKPPMCVTGANGFIGSWLVKALLERGYTRIHLSIFPGTDASHLFSLPRAADRLTVHHADLLDSAAVYRAVEGCAGGGVFHVASPCTLEDPVDPQSELLDPAVKGTLNVLAAAKRFGVRRVVLTSSISAMVPNPGWPGGRVVDESCWTVASSVRFTQFGLRLELTFAFVGNHIKRVAYTFEPVVEKWYPVSKTLAEKAAWDFAKENGMDVVAINPATCLGQLLQPALNASCAVLQKLLQGSKDTQEYFWLGVVHVKDVAKAQLLLFETPTASGRYLCTNGIYQFGDFAKKISELFPEFPVHRFTGETQPGLVACKDAAKRLIDLGLIFTPVEDAVRDTVSSLKAKGLLGHHLE